MTDLIKFLTARYDQAESIARHAGGGEWRTLCEHGDDCPDYPSCSEIEGDGFRIYPEGGHSSWQADHIALNDPAAKLRDIAGKRAILALHRLKVAKREQYRYDPSTGEPIPDEHDGDCEICGWFAPEDGGCLTVRCLAGEFSGHPEFRPGWAVPDAT